MDGQTQVYIRNQKIARFYLLLTVTDKREQKRQREVRVKDEPIEVVESVKHRGSTISREGNWLEKLIEDYRKKDFARLLKLSSVQQRCTT